jgi:hypothetical protein
MPKISCYDRDGRKSPILGLLKNSHVEKSVTYEVQNNGLRVFRQSHKYFEIQGSFGKSLIRQLLMLQNVIAIELVEIPFLALILLFIYLLEHFMFLTS